MHCGCMINKMLNQIFYYTRCSTLKCVISLQGPPRRYCVRTTQLNFRKNVAAVASHWQHCV